MERIPTRFATWPPWAALALLGVVTALVALAIAAPRAPAYGPASTGHDDEALYAAVAERVGAGQGYYPAAAAEQRARDYPTTPAVVFRQPALAWLMAALRFDRLRQAALFALAGLVAVTVLAALEREGVPQLGRVTAMAALATSLSDVGVTPIFLLHEIWAGLFIALSLALYRPQRWVLPVCVGVVACLFRELAAPYLLAMAAFALLERRWREAFGWVGGLLVFALVFAVHLHAASGLHRAGDLPSASWVAFGGLPFVLDTARRNVALIGAPSPFVAAAVCLALLGFVGARNAIAARLALIVGGYLAAFLVVGRPNNAYWGLLYAPILPLGLILAPAAVRDLVRQALRLVADRKLSAPAE